MTNFTSIDGSLIASPDPSKLQPHPEALPALFENRCEIQAAFSPLKRLCGIHYMSLVGINPAYEFIAFSSVPNIEYNLIHQKLWRADPCFTAILSSENSLLWWDYTDPEIRQIKLRNNGFALGMTLCRKVAGFSLLYSFATREDQEDLREFYQKRIFKLIDMGDYFYKSLRSLYSSYAGEYQLPPLSAFDSKAAHVDPKPKLRLIHTPLSIGD